MGKLFIKFSIKDEIKYLKRMLTADVFYMFFSSDSGYKEVREDSTFLEVKENIIDTI